VGRNNAEGYDRETKGGSIFMAEEKIMPLKGKLE
jgi:hypothetical protein